MFSYISGVKKYDVFTHKWSEEIVFTHKWSEEIRCFHTQVE